VWCGNSTDGSSPLIFQVNFLSAIRVKLIFNHINKKLLNKKELFTFFNSNYFILIVVGFL
ncbi:hypothetical protein ABTP71_16405, partial [Acinetobacter baumannii]